MLNDTKTGLKASEFEAAALIHMDSVYRFALYMAEDESDAQKLVQNTYLKAYKSFDEIQEGTDCRAWLFAILNGILNIMTRSKEHHQRHRGSADGAYERIGKSPLDSAIRKLPIGYRAAVLLADMEGLSYSEIAAIMGYSVDNAISRVCSGRSILAKRLQGLGMQETKKAVS